MVTVYLLLSQAVCGGMGSRGACYGVMITKAGLNILALLCFYVFEIGSNLIAT